MPGSALIVDYFVFLSKYKKTCPRHKAESGEVFSGQALVTRGFLLEAGERPPRDSSIPEDALRSCLLLEITKIQVL